MIGIGELIVFALIFIIIGIPFIFKRYYPNKLWVGIILSLFFGTGQFYLPGGTKYFMGLALSYVILKIITGNEVYALMIAHLFSVGIIYWRFLKIEQKT